MVEFFIYIFFAYGLTNLLVFGSGPWDILGKFRDFADKHISVLGNMLKCMMCTSANVGWILSAINLLLFPSHMITPFYNVVYDSSLWPIIIFGDMCFTSGIVWVIHTAQETLERAFNYGE